MFLRIFLTLMICVLFYLSCYKKRNARLPPGPGRWPILGSLIQLHRANSQYVHIALAKLATKHGDIMSFGLGMQTADNMQVLVVLVIQKLPHTIIHEVIMIVVVSSFETMKNVFQRADTNSHRYEFPYVYDRNYGKNLGILWSHGDTWVDVRTFTKKVLKEFGYGKHKIMNGSLVESANHLVDSIKIELLDSADGIFFVESQTFSIHAVNVLWNLIGGYKFNSNDELIKRNMECTDKIVGILSHGNPYNVFPFLKHWFPKQVHHPEHLEIHKEVHDFTKVLINDAKEKRSQRLNSEPTSFIEVFMDKIEDNREDSETIFTHEQLEIILEDLFLTGLETTGTFLAWSVLFLVQNPDVQRRLRHDIIARNMRRTEDLQLIELKKIPYLKATVLETLRMGNVVPIPLPRRATENIEIREYIIPKGTILFYNLYAMYNDENYWTHPNIFKPERFLQENGDISIPQSERILNTVFGTGTRICFGESLAIDSLIIFLGALIVNFRFEVIPGLEPSAEHPNATFCICPRKYCVKIIPQLS